MAWLVSRPGVPTRVKLYTGLAFEVLGSYGIAASEYHDITAPIMHQGGSADFGVSWVPVWVMLFTVVVPAQPRLALLSAALSLSAIPVMFALGGNMYLHPIEYFFILIFPYLVVLIMAYVGSRVVYRLGAAVTKARKMGKRLRHADDGTFYYVMELLDGFDLDELVERSVRCRRSAPCTSSGRSARPSPRPTRPGSVTAT